MPWFVKENFLFSLLIFLLSLYTEASKLPVVYTEPYIYLEYLFASLDPKVIHLKINVNLLRFYPRLSIGERSPSETNLTRRCGTTTTTTTTTQKNLT